MMQHEQPTIVFENEDVRGVCLSAVHSLPGCGGDIFEARHPGCCALNFDADVRHVNTHERRVPEDLFPTSPDVFPTRQPVPIGMDTDGTGIGRPHFVHQIQIKAFESEVELEVSLDHLFGIGHKV